MSRKKMEFRDSRKDENRKRKGGGQRLKGKRSKENK